MAKMLGSIIHTMAIIFSMIFTKLSKIMQLIQPTTYRDYIASMKQAEIVGLPILAAGSWVYGTFSTWIGDQGQKPRLGSVMRGKA